MRKSVRPATGVSSLMCFALAASLEAPVCRSARRPKGQRPKGDALKCRQGHDPNTGSKRCATPDSLDRFVSLAS